MSDDIVEHLTTVDVFEDHVVMMLVSYDFSHSADVGVVEEERERSFTDCTDFFGCVF